jgi:hypothetical protein
VVGSDPATGFYVQVIVLLLCDFGRIDRSWPGRRT